MGITTFLVAIISDDYLDYVMSDAALSKVTKTDAFKEFLSLFVDHEGDTLIYH